MDDANVPSLLSLPVLGYLSKTHNAYQLTREFVLSEENPYYFKGSEGEGIGGPHEGYNYTWPMSITMQAMTSDNDEEILNCLDTLVRSSVGTGLIHETFNVNNMNDYTRTWFAWANGLVGELLLQLLVTKPQLLVGDDEEVIKRVQSVVTEPVSLLAQQEALIQ